MCARLRARACVCVCACVCVWCTVFNQLIDSCMSDHSRLRGHYNVGFDSWQFRGLEHQVPNTREKVSKASVTDGVQERVRETVIVTAMTLAV